MVMNQRPSRRKATGTTETKSILHERVRQILIIERLCGRFHLVAKQLQSRHAHRETLRVVDEYDVQDLLHALLILEHDNVTLEEWQPSYANGESRTDFLLKLERVVIQAKMTRRDFGAGEVAEQFSLDLEKYQSHPDCRMLICFIYDPEGRIANPKRVESDLSFDGNTFSARVIVAPQAR